MPVHFSFHTVGVVASGAQAAGEKLLIYKVLIIPHRIQLLTKMCI
jgi:hypothetical protein